MALQSLGNIVDVIVEPRYDTNTIPAAGALSLTYFALPVGQGLSAFAGAGVTKTYADTNMDLAGQLPAGYNFKILGFRIMPAFWISNSLGTTLVAGNLTDACRWSHGALFTFTIGSKPFLRVPVDTIPAGMGPTGWGGDLAANFSSGASHGFPALSNAYTIGKQPLDLASTQNFSATITWPLITPVDSAFAGHQPAAGLPVKVFLDGYLYRIVQ